MANIIEILHFKIITFVNVKNLHKPLTAVHNYQPQYCQNGCHCQSLPPYLKFAVNTLACLIGALAGALPSLFLD